ncbi:MAG: ribosomal-processing cysteine protease Prp [Lachnospiraceae bacterium]|nr:ribosomal-processing cysteine protease Prp [Lachnospiraceae bacterium]
MIHIKFYLDADRRYKGFAIKGHAGYAAYGSDIICAAVSALSTNTVNSLETFSSDRIETRTEEKLGALYLRLVTRADETSQLLIKSLALGLESIRGEYGSKYIKILYKEA